MTAVQNGQRLATKQDLKDMYDGILPYLGGMPEALANKFSKGDLYDSTEKMIGKWTNGKPLYQITLQSTMPSGTEVGINVSSLSIDHIVSYSGFHFSDAFEGVLPTTSSDNFTCFPYYKKENTTLYIYNSINAYAGRTAYITIQYTKTTDSANSFNFGEETDYSTTEKIVGTWIDGKPLYQKVFSQTFSSGDDNDYYIDAPEGTNVVLMDAYYVTSTVCNPIPSLYIVSAKGDIGGGLTILYEYSNHRFRIRPGVGGWFGSGATVLVVAKYTKSS